MMRSIADDTTKDIWNGVNSKAGRRVPRELWPVIRRKLDQVDAVTQAERLANPPAIDCTPCPMTWRDTTRYA